MKRKGKDNGLVAEYERLVAEYEGLVAGYEGLVAGYEGLVSSRKVSDIIVKRLVTS